MLRTLPLAAVAVCILASCAAPPAALPEEIPADFAVLATVYPHPEQPPEAWMRPARYAVEPDGLLRAESGAGVTSPGFPPLVRRLDPGEIRRIYALTRQAGPLSPGATPVMGVNVYEPPRDDQVALIEVRAEHRYISGAVPILEAAPLIRELAGLSWLDRTDPEPGDLP